LSDYQTPSFKDFLEGWLLQEAYKNLFSAAEKEPYASEVYQMLQTSYAAIGGIKGSGFTSEEDMVNNIPMWKLSVRGENILACVMYKDTNGRKMVAVGTNGKADGKQALLDILKVEFGRSYSEISGSLLKFMERNLPEIINQYRIPVVDVEQILGKSVEPVDEYFYIRSIGGDSVKKLMLGTVGKTISR